MSRKIVSPISRGRPRYSVFKGVTLEDGVFCGPSMVFTNIYNPRAEIRKMDQVRPTRVKHGATLGANCTIVCGITIGRYAFIGGGALINKDVPDHALVVGNPAKQIGWACACGERLSDNFECNSCKRNYRVTESGILKNKHIQFFASHFKPITSNGRRPRLQLPVLFTIQDLTPENTTRVKSGLDPFSQDSPETYVFDTR